MQKLLALTQKPNYTTFQIRPVGVIGLQHIPASQDIGRLLEVGIVVSNPVIFTSLLFLNQRS
jgi:hypothetical protein